MASPRRVRHSLRGGQVHRLRHWASRGSGAEQGEQQHVSRSYWDPMIRRERRDRPEPLAAELGDIEDRPKRAQPDGCARNEPQDGRHSEPIKDLPTLKPHPIRSSKLSALGGTVEFREISFARNRSSSHANKLRRTPSYTADNSSSQRSRQGMEEQFHL